MRIMDQYTKEQLQEIVSNNYSCTQCLKILGYSAVSGDTLKAFRQKLQDLNISIEHFTATGVEPGAKKIIKNKIPNPYEVLFIKDSAYTQSTLRRYYSEKFPPERCAICGSLPIWLNKPLTFILDHINGINNDNRIDNLRWVCPNCNSQLPTTGAKNIIRHINTCIDCGKIISKGALRCIECQKLWRNNPNNPDKKDDYPSRELLKTLIFSKPFNEIGRMYKVDGNTIRKWCRKLNLPSRKYEINTYTEEEWKDV